ncbi:uncharacterized protein LOC113209974 isoform X4 [Frankliniella occidentalis]|uniref:Uncharacterized protein LOC113209974 isoform X4 n=1 Tax=Frankliniella occidentalis TaxID=133901 RepID=A0A9C6X277_FRAOC|nr:uncharacterized protein LOC113209974 isoform X4 [Frankliniella occidentalis]
MDERRHGGFQVPRSSWSHRRGRWRSRWMPNKVNRSPRQQFGVYATHAQHGRSGRTPLDIRRRSLSLSPGRGGRVRLRRSTTTPPPPPQGDSSPAPSSSHPSHQHEPLGDPPGAQDEEGEDGQRKEPPPRKKLRVYGPTRYHDETIRDVPELEAEAKPEVKVKSERNQRNVERSAEAAETLMVKSEIVSVQPQNDRMVRPTVKSQIVKVEPKIEPQADTKKEPEADTKKQPQVEGKEELKVQPQSEQKPEPSRHGEKRHASSDKPDTSPDTAVEEPVLGIDLGTTNSVVAVVQDGDVEVLHNDICSRLTPSCVHVSDVRQVGEGALRLAVTDPDKTVRNIKCVLGRLYQDIIEDSSRPLGPVRVELDSATGNAFVAVDEHRLPPEVVAASILVELKKAAEAHLGRAVSKAVISVPTYFNAAQRHAVRDAGTLAGLEVLQLVNEPTAAAMAYAHGREFTKTIVVVDVGGGGSSISVVRVDHDKISVLASSGQPLPGGEDFDNTMMEHLKQIIKSKLQKDVTDERSNEILRSNFERAKQKLSRIPLASISTFLPGVDMDCEIDIKREDFESVCEVSFNLIARTIVSIVKASKVDAIDDVILIGGSTRIPSLRSLIQKVLGGKIGKAINPDEAVAKGAALLGAGCVKLSQEILTATCSFSMGSSLHQIPLQQPVPLRRKIQCSNDIKFKQNGKIVIIWSKPEVPNVILSICESGIIKFKGTNGQPHFMRPRGCLSFRKQREWRKKMEKQAMEETLELDRVKHKNILENAIREQLSKEVKDPLHPSTVVLQKKFAQELEWLEENPRAPLEELTKRKEELHQLGVAWNHEMAKKEEEDTKAQLAFALNNILNRKISESDIARDIEVQLKKRCKDFCARLKTLNFKDSLEAAKEYMSMYESIHKEDQALTDERFKRTIAMQNLEEKLRAAMFVDQNDIALQEALKVKEKWTEKWNWLLGKPAESAENVLEYCKQVNEDLLHLSSLRDEVANAVHNFMEVDEEANEKNFAGVLVGKCDLTQTRPQDNFAVVWDNVQAVIADSAQAPLAVPPLMLSCLADALAMQALREAHAAQRAVLLVDKAVTERCDLLSLGVCFADAAGNTVERLLLVRQVDYSLGVPAADDVLFADFQALCSRCGVDWRHKWLMGVCTDSSGAYGEAFLARMRDAVADPTRILKLPGRSRLDEMVVAKLHAAAAETDFDAEKAPLGVSDTFCTLDALRKLFAADGRWFPVLRDACGDLEDGDDPWATYEDSVGFTRRHREAVLKALFEVAKHDPAQQQHARHLHGSVLSDWPRSSFWCVIQLFDELFRLTHPFSPDLDFGELLRRAEFFPEFNVPACEANLLNRMRAPLLQSRARKWTEADEEYLSQTVRLCTSSTADVLELVERVLAEYYPYMQILHPFLGLGNPPPELLSRVDDKAFVADVQRMGQGFSGVEHPAFPSVPALLLHCREHFPALGEKLSSISALPYAAPPESSRAVDLLREGSRRLRTCPLYSLPHAIVVAMSPRGARDGHVLDRATKMWHRQQTAM